MTTWVESPAVFKCFNSSWGVMAAALHPWSWLIKIFLLSLYGLECFEHGQKQSLGSLHIWDAQWIIGQWGSALRKSFETMGVFVGFWRREYSSSSSEGSKSGGESSWFWRRVSEYWIAAITADKWASLLYFSNCQAKTRRSLCQKGWRQSRNSFWLTGSSNCWSSNVCAALDTGSAVWSTVNKGTLGTWWLAFGLTAEAA